MTYIPSGRTLERYAAVLVDFALGGGEGIKQGETVRVTAPECAKPLYLATVRVIMGERLGILVGCAFPAVMWNMLVGQTDFSPRR